MRIGKVKRGYEGGTNVSGNQTHMKNSKNFRKEMQEKNGSETGERKKYILRIGKITSGKVLEDGWQ